MNVIEVSDLAFRWPRQASDVLKISEFTVKQGEKVFLEGPSGSGKSTLLGLLAGINQASHGEVTILGQKFSELKGSQRDKFRANHIGYIFQMFNLLPYLSVIENVMLPCRFSPLRQQRINSSLEQEAKRLLKQLHLPTDCLNKPISELSIGQQQRVAAARALMGQPELLIADEPTSSLDHNNREAFIELLMTECERSNTTLLFVSHDQTLQGLFDRTVSLNEINTTHHETTS
ncbi:methionine ABC transporter ATP-binding protein [Photobacterium jeanii]|uniref:Methionine ABC transporter ATP-binding protein n=1 Tax=Photobacterium jeanii TaxID=858640 RepID=A0A178KPD9_9GAMM|nr:ABC transporter ATP-binding protein [Photobacterium jeanii]OAN18976.1 methionine ABC transporter ATP-binding protein [Photobacterium jeanii]PST87638.1 ABC transporter ATP-binding protein [Photobacterium jeanii]